MAINASVDVILLLVFVVLHLFDSFIQGAIRFAKVCVFVALVIAWAKRLSRKAYFRLTQRLFQRIVNLYHVSHATNESEEPLRAQSYSID